MLNFLKTINQEPNEAKKTPYISDLLVNLTIGGTSENELNTLYKVKAASDIIGKGHIKIYILQKILENLFY